jgi:rhamnosyltransferase
MLASIVIRTLNEARHLNDLLVMIGRQKTLGLEVQVTVIDSGSTDGTIEIANRHGANLQKIDRSEFSFGRSLNRGCLSSSGEILVFVSGHCVPVDEDWLNNLCRPLLDGTAHYTYGRQIGDDGSNFSERRIFAKYFPDESNIPQSGFFCNNANSAILRSVWQAFPFDEELTGLEDMELAKRLVAAGMKIGYVSDSSVFHHHQESWKQVRRRFEREAIALRTIMPEIHLSYLDVLRFVVASTFGDWRSAVKNGVTSTPYIDMLRYRWNQYIGSFKGNREHRLISHKMKEDFFYPQISEKAEKDEWLKSLRRASPNEG